MDSASIPRPAVAALRRRLRRAAHRPVSTLVPPAVAVAAIFLLGCPEAFRSRGDTNATTSSEAGAEQQDDSNPESSTSEATDPATDATATANADAATNPLALGVGTTAQAEVRGPDTAATATAEQQRCYEATATTSMSLFMLNNYQFGVAWSAPPAFAASVSSELTLQKNDEQPIVVANANGTASIFGDGSIDGVGLPAFSFFGAGRYGAQEQISHLDIESVVPGDRIVLRTRVEVRATLPDGAGSFDVSEASAATSATIDFGLVEVSCTNPECQVNEDCPGGELCDLLNGVCVPPSFATDPGIAATTQPSPPVGPFSLTMSWDVHAGDLQALVTEAVIPLAEKDAFNGIAEVNQGVGFCAIGPINVPVLTTLDEDVLYVDVDGNLVHDPADDATIVITEEASTMRIRVDTPKGGDGSTAASLVPFDATITCTGFFGLFDGAKLGPGSITIESTSVDPDTGDFDDDGDLDPLDVSLALDLLGAGDCGNGNLDDGEECDDGNTVDGDGCSATCQTEASPEICGDGVDNDADGRIDLLDPGCSAGPLTITRASVSLAKAASGDEKVVLVATFPPAGVDPPAEGVTLIIVDPGSGPQDPDERIFRVHIPPAATGWKTSKQGRMTFKDTKGGPLGDPASKDAVAIKLNAKKQRYELTVNVTEAEVAGPLEAGEVSTQLAIGGQAWEVTQPWALNKKGTILKPAK